MTNEKQIDDDAISNKTLRKLEPVALLSEEELSTVDEPLRPEPEFPSKEPSVGVILAQYLEALF